ncbi:hypothetical protein ACJ6WD_11310 [Streptomyces sp. VTCC 41912]|uniref:hypothetical protein n=1 Tax=Streptomyces sp. VTCC 41912 TaxID=3383243 RepID=UPI003896EC96
MAFGIGRRLDRLSEEVDGLSERIGHAQQAITDALDRSLTSLRTTIEATLNAAQNARDTAALTHARTDAIHSELQGLRNETQRLQPAPPPRDEQQILNQLAELRHSIEGLRTDLAAVKTPEPPTPPTKPDPQVATQPPSEGDDFERLLGLAARIAYAQLTCHRDHWDFLVAQSSSGQHFRLPAGVKEANGLIQAEISGRTLIAALDALRATEQDPAAPIGTRTFAAVIYERIGAALYKVDGDQADAHYQAGNNCPPVTHIIIDDRPPASGS